MSPSRKAAPDGFAEHLAAAAIVISIFRRAIQHFGGDRADRWMRAGHPALGMRHPEHLCTEARAMEACLAALAETLAAVRSRRS
jgi:hypothetical protein